MTRRTLIAIIAVVVGIPLVLFGSILLWGRLSSSTKNSNAGPATYTDLNGKVYTVQEYRQKLAELVQQYEEQDRIVQSNYSEAAVVARAATAGELANLGISYAYDETGQPTESMIDLAKGRLDCDDAGLGNIMKACPPAERP